MTVTPSFEEMSTFCCPLKGPKSSRYRAVRCSTISPLAASDFPPAALRCARYPHLLFGHRHVVAIKRGLAPHRDGETFPSAGVPLSPIGIAIARCHRISYCRSCFTRNFTRKIFIIVTFDPGTRKRCPIDAVLNGQALQICHAPRIQGVGAEFDRSGQFTLQN